jgi:hypothetical protein
MAVVCATMVLLAGCGTTGVTVLSQSTYSVSAQYGSLSGSWARARQEAVEQAKEFCAGKGQI